MGHARAGGIGDGRGDAYRETKCGRGKREYAWKKINREGLRRMVERMWGGGRVRSDQFAFANVLCAILAHANGKLFSVNTAEKNKWIGRQAYREFFFRYLIRALADFQNGCSGGQLVRDGSHDRGCWLGVIGVACSSVASTFSVGQLFANLCPLKLTRSHSVFLFRQRSCEER